jgi:hypothetical protein
LAEPFVIAPVLLLSGSDHGMTVAPTVADRGDSPE